MTDRRKSTPPAVPVSPELQPPLRGVKRALRATFLADLPAEQARKLDREVETALEADCGPLEFPGAVLAAVEDLAFTAAFLDEWADNLGDGVERNDIRLAGAVLDALPVLYEQAGILGRYARDARDDALLAGVLDPPTDGAPGSARRPPADLPELPGLPERDRPALRRVFAVQLRPAERETLEELADNLLELSREGSSAVRAVIDYTSFPDDLRAVALDLRHAERFLRVVGASEGDALERWESRLADLAAQLAAPVGAIAGQLEAAVEAAPIE